MDRPIGFAAATAGQSLQGLSFTDALNDLTCRFIVNVPKEELVTIERVCFQIEQAHWFYEDFMRPENPHLPTLPFKVFLAKCLKHCPLLHHWAHDADKACQIFSRYKTDVPVCGGVVLDPTLEHVLLVRGWNALSWSFPRGKINKNESMLQCAVREVEEEVGFDMTKYLVPFQKSSSENRDQNILAQALDSKNKFLEPAAALENDLSSYFFETSLKRKKVRMYLGLGVPLSTRFKTQTRKEISEIKWHPVSTLVGGNSNIRMGPIVVPFLAALRIWISGEAERPMFLHGLLGKTVFLNHIKQANIDAAQNHKLEVMAKKNNRRKKAASNSSANDAYFMSTASIPGAFFMSDVCFKLARSVTSASQLVAGESCGDAGLDDILEMSALGLEDSHFTFGDLDLQKTPMGSKKMISDQQSFFTLPRTTRTLDSCFQTADSDLFSSICSVGALNSAPGTNSSFSNQRATGPYASFVSATAAPLPPQLPQEFLNRFLPKPAPLSQRISKTENETLDDALDAGAGQRAPEVTKTCCFESPVDFRLNIPLLMDVFRKAWSAAGATTFSY